ncbi:MAG: hypothetical protein EXS29_06480 [Pedosphaera sp.]|nr:hypothetical protein [Pedosphaera sp.]MST00937.1 hypothetical protein [Pedosphaera sp.]
MGLLLILPVAAIAIAVLIGTYRRLRLVRADRRWWILFAALCIGGLVLGSWFAFHFTYQPNANTKITGAPIPSSISQLQDGKWTDSTRPLPSALHWLANLANVLSGVALALLPLGIASVCIELRDDIRARREIPPKT